MYKDPIVAEVQKIRDELAKAFDYNVHAIIADIRSREPQLGPRLLSPPEKRKTDGTPPSRSEINGMARGDASPSRTTDHTS